jgi:hypothetical protein
VGCDASGPRARAPARNARTRNAQRATAASDRFNDDHGDPELGEIVAGLRGLPPELNTHVVVNNTMEDQGQRNAKLQRAPLDLPGALR